MISAYRLRGFLRSIQRHCSSYSGHFHPHLLLATLAIIRYTPESMKNHHTIQSPPAMSLGHSCHGIRLSGSQSRLRGLCHAVLTLTKHGIVKPQWRPTPLFNLYALIQY